MADLLASEYGWSRNEIWWEIGLPEIMLYVQAIQERRNSISGNTDSNTTGDAILNVLEVIDEVKRDKYGN